jgi:hypothetical protein
MTKLLSASRPLEERILDSFPSGDYAMTALLQLVDIVESDAVESAAVECVPSPRMLINPAFVAAHCPTSDSLLMLVMHELHHVLLGHTRQFPRVTPIDNLVFDAVINSMLCRLFPDPNCRRFFTDLYPDDQFPECLLRPPDRWSPGTRPSRVRLPPALTGEGMERAAQVYRSLYSAGGASYEDLYEILAGEVSPEDAARVVLVGGHGEWAETGDSPLEPSVMFEIVETLSAGWPKVVSPVSRRSMERLLDESRFEAKRPSRSNRSKLRRLFKRVGGRLNSSSGIPGGGGVSEEGMVQGPIPTCDRRGVVMRSLGRPPLLYTNPVQQKHRARFGLTRRVHVYVDVSGSIGQLTGALYGAVLDCEEFVHPQVHLFSTGVSSVTLRQLKLGICRSTGGTDINCVASHMRRHGVERAVLITDGEVWEPTDRNRQTLCGVRLGVALCGWDQTREFLDDVTDFWTQLSL